MVTDITCWPVCIVSLEIEDFHQVLPEFDKTLDHVHFDVSEIWLEMWGVSCLHCLWHHQYHQSTDCRYCTAQIVQSNGVLRYMITRHTWWQAIHGYHHSVECQPVVNNPSESQLRHRMNMGWWISVRPWDFQLDLWRDDYQDGHMVTERHFLDFHMTQNNVHHHACEYEHKLHLGGFSCHRLGFSVVALLLYSLWWSFSCSTSQMMSLSYGWRWCSYSKLLPTFCRKAAVIRHLEIWTTSTVLG